MYCIACKSKKEQNKQCPNKARKGERFCGKHLNAKFIFNDNMNSESNDKKTKTIKQKKENTKKKTDKQIIIDSIFKPNKYGVSEWIPISKLIETKLPSGIGLWSEKSNGNQRNGIFLNDARYNWDSQRLNNKPKGKILKLRTIGFNNDILKGHNRPIRKDIKDYCKTKTCVFCRSSSNIIADHKNDLYNDLRVLCLDTQRQDDFQPCCNACNLRKNKVTVKTKKENKRQPPPDMIRKTFGIDFTVGDETFDQDINAMVGTYWNDPIDFINKALTMKLKEKDDEILSLQNKLKEIKITESEE